MIDLRKEVTYNEKRHSESILIKYIEEILLCTGEQGPKAEVWLTLWSDVKPSSCSAI